MPHALLTPKAHRAHQSRFAPHLHAYRDDAYALNKSVGTWVVYAYASGDCHHFAPRAYLHAARVARGVRQQLR